MPTSIQIAVLFLTWTSAFTASQELEGVDDQNRPIIPFGFWYKGKPSIASQLQGMYLERRSAFNRDTRSLVPRLNQIQDVIYNWRPSTGKDYYDQMVSGGLSPRLEPMVGQTNVLKMKDAPETGFDEARPEYKNMLLEILRKNSVDLNNGHGDFWRVERKAQSAFDQNN